MLAVKAFQNWILILELKLFPFTKTNRKLWNKITIFQLKKIYLKLFSTKRTFIQKDFPPEDGCAGVPALSYEPRSLCIPILQKDDEEDAAIAEDDDEHHHHDATILLLESPCSLLLLIIPLLVRERSASCKHGHACTYQLQGDHVQLCLMILVWRALKIK